MIESQGMVNSTLHPGQVRDGYRVHYVADNTTEDLELEEVRPIHQVVHLPECKRTAAALAQAVLYLENRITGQCDDQYHSSTCYEVLRLVRVFAPNNATNHLTE